MSPSSRIIAGFRSRRILLLAIAAGSAALGLCALLTGLDDRVGTAACWRAALAFLTILESAYLATVGGILAVMPFLIWLALRRQYPGTSRALLAVASLTIALAAAEAAAAAWLAGASRSSAVPVGGLRGAQVDRQRMWPPVSLADVAMPESFPDPPGDPEIDFLVVGESSAEGVPYNEWVSIGRLVAWKLEEAIPGRRVRLRVLANSGDTLELQHHRLASLTRRPDLMLVYCGHNEFGSRLHGAREILPYDDDRTPSPWRRLLDRAEGLSPLCELIRRAEERCRLELPPSGHRDLIDTPAYTPDEAALLLADFRRRLDAIVSYAGRIGAMAVLIVPPGNDAGFEPNRSYLPAATPRAEREAFRRDVLAARRIEESDPAAAIAAYRRLIGRQPGFAETHYRLGVLLDRAGDAESAYRYFVAARDADGYPVRCPIAFQDACRDVARRSGAILVDGQAELHAIGRRGLLDDHLFQDAMHPSLRGQIALAQAVLRALRDRRAFGWPGGTPAPTIDPAGCAARFGLGPDAWKKLCLWGIRFGTYAQGLRHDPTSRLRRKAIHAAAYDRLVADEPVESLGLPNIGLPEPVPIPARRGPSGIGIAASSGTQP